MAAKVCGAAFQQTAAYVLKNKPALRALIEE
jgi:hypothetical protein